MRDITQIEKNLKDVEILKSKLLKERETARSKAVVKKVLGYLSTAFVDSKELKTIDEVECVLKNALKQINDYGETMYNRDYLAMDRKKKSEGDL